MKKFFALLLLSLVFFGCSDEVEFNSPAVQGKKDGNRWKAVAYNATFDDNGRLVVTASDNYDDITLRVSSLSVGTEFVLGQNNVDMASLVNNQGDSFSTNNLPDGDTQVYPPEGIIKITRYNQSKNTVSGEFWFNAYNELGNETVNFNRGVFFDLPLPYTSSDVVSCEEAIIETQTAQEAYFNSDPATDPSYSAKCHAYMVALMQQQDSCVDETGMLQEVIDGLLCDDDDEDGVMTVLEDIDGDGNPENDDTDMDGTPNYLDTDDDDDTILTINEDVDGDGNFTNDDTDTDGIPNYLDNDDDGDGILTADEDANGDGDLTNDDTDMDGIPDYLDAE
ncbi:DUF6252 family protein [Mangrovimonas cancribranchiae]|uniref:DUF6252 family protein n=1 Tax=Mangrovimonas cancribranchiae TaxID=3080055 RepID=A0AAU6P2N3_9FLAO